MVLKDKKKPTGDFSTSFGQKTTTKKLRYLLT